MIGTGVSEPLPGSGVRNRWVAGALLGLGGLGLNLLFSISLSPGTDLLFGGVAYLVAAAAFGPGPGLIAAMIASVNTLWLWNQPYAWAIFSLEGLAVGYLVRHWNRRPLTADFLFWLVAGPLLFYLTYQLRLGMTGVLAAFMFAKLAFNGFVNALLAEGLLLVPRIRQSLGIMTAPRLRSALAVVLSLLAVVPALVLGVREGQREWRRSLNRAEDRAVLLASSYASKLEQYTLLHAHAVRSVAEAARWRGEWNADRLQALLEAEDRHYPGFANMYAGNARGVAVAFSPRVNSRGQSTIGMAFSDRAYFREVRDTRRTVISEVFAGRGGADEPMVIIAHPIVLADTFAGYILGAMDLRALPRPGLALEPNERLRVADRNGRLLLDSHNPYRAGGTPQIMVDSAAFQAVRALGDRAGATAYGADAATTAASRTAARVLIGAAPIPIIGWSVWVERPMRTIQNAVGLTYARLIGLLIGVMLLALLLSNALARWMASPLLRVRDTAAALAAGDLTGRVGTLRGDVPAEITEMGRQFDDMAASLAGRTEELEELGEIARSLASTLDTDELLRRITDSAVRLVESDGCGIALLRDGGAYMEVVTTAGPAGPTVGTILHSSEEPTLDGGGYTASVPLNVGKEKMGLLVAVRREQRFGPADQALLSAFADNAGVALRNARLLEDAQAASRAKSDFIATMSHELRTPLNAVLGHLELLEMGIHGETTPAQQEAMGRIGAATRHLRGLIEEVLSFVRIESGRIEVNVAPTDVCALTEEVAAVIEPLAQQKNLSFSVERCTDAPTIPTDPDKVRQIVINLAGNAVKFTSEGKVRIAVQQRGDEVVLTVSDTGPGIAEQDRLRLFQPFEQLQTGFTRAHGGTGLGLYLSGRLAEILGGRIEVESELGRGSAFSLILPKSGPQGEKKSRVDAPAAVAGARG